MILTPVTVNVEATPTANAQNVAEEGAAAAKTMMAKCIVGNTSKGYNARIEIMKTWFKNNPMRDETGTPVELFLEDQQTLRLPVPTHAVLAFFGFLGDQKVQKNGGEQSEAEVLKAASTMGGYRSALAMHYKQRGKFISEELETSLSTYMSGYKRSL